MACTESGYAKRLVVRTYIWVEGGEGTWMLSWSDRQPSIETVSGWLGVFTVERDRPPNMREIGDSNELAYSCP